jgi:hypothetical protein
VHVRRLGRQARVNDLVALGQLNEDRALGIAHNDPVFVFVLRHARVATAAHDAPLLGHQRVHPTVIASTDGSL